MDKKDQIVSITSAIKELCGLIFVIETEQDYTKEQAATYFKQIFEMHDITPREEEPEEEEE